MSPQSRYTRLRKIADGGTAEIFLAKQTGASGFEKLVVLKRIFSTFYSDPQFRHMLVDEAHIAMSLYHSNIVQVLDLGEADGRHFLALELVDGWTLDEVLKRARTAHFPFPPALALYVTAEVCRALAYAHSKSRDGQPLGIVHRDVSPHNVLLSEHGEIKLTDFGMAKTHIRHEQSVGNLIKGKIAFMSPEQARGHELDARSDLFSLGVVLYLMIAGRPPFDAPSDYETLMQVRAGDFLPPETARPRLNPEVHRVIRKAMANAPADRYQSAADMLADVEQVMRVGFRAVGQTELARWLFDLTAKDGVPPLTRAQPTSAADDVVIDTASVTSAATVAAPSGAYEIAPAPEPSAAPVTASSVEQHLDGDVTPPPRHFATPAPQSAVAGAPVPPPVVALDTRHEISPVPLPFWQRPSLRKAVTRGAAVALALAIAAGALKIAGSYKDVTSATFGRDRRVAPAPSPPSSSRARMPAESPPSTPATATAPFASRPTAISRERNGTARSATAAKAGRPPKDRSRYRRARHRRSARTRNPTGAPGPGESDDGGWHFSR